MTTEVKELTIEQLKAKMAEALKSGDDAAFMATVSEINKHKADVAKSAAEAAAKEAEALAGKRTNLEKDILKAIAAVKLSIDGKEITLDKALIAIKGRGFHYFVSHNETEAGVWEDGGAIHVKQSVGLALPVVKGTRKSSGGAGGSGKSKEEFGLSLDEIWTKFAGAYATAEDRAAYDAAVTDKNNSKTWQIKVKVKKAAIKAGALAPVK